MYSDGGVGTDDCNNRASAGSQPGYIDARTASESCFVEVAPGSMPELVTRGATEEEASLDNVTVVLFWPATDARGFPETADCGS